MLTSNGPRVNSERELETAFNLFNRLSVRLEHAYGDLEHKVASLDAELRVARREREAQRAEKERIADRLAGLLAELPVGVVLVGAKGLIEEANRAARDMLDGPLLGSSWEEVVARNLAGSPNTGDLTPRPGHRITVTRRSLAGSACIIVLTDVTEIHELQQRATRNERLSEMGEMAARLAHQIRTPVASAMLYASAMASSGTNDTRRSAQKILGRLRHLEATVNDMLMFAKGGGGKRERLLALDLLDLAHSTLDPRIQKFVVVGRSDAAGDTRVVANRETLAGALGNLATNAVEAGALEVVMGVRRSQSNGVELTVADNGPGIDAEIADTLFDPFFTTRAGGTGLGLAVVRSVAESHGGTVRVERNGSGGATFVVHVPEASSDVECPPLMAAGA